MKKELNWQSNEIIEIYDEAPLWSAPFGKMLLDNIPMNAHWTVVDIGFGTGFPLVELAQRFGEKSTIIGIDIWQAAIGRTRIKLDRLGIQNVKILDQDASTPFLSPNSVDLVCSNLGINNVGSKADVFRNVYDVLKVGGHFCMTLNSRKTFEELFILFKRAMHQLDIDLKTLKDYVNARTEIMHLIEQLKSTGFSFENQEEGASIMRFATSEAVFNHGLIRIAFLSDWRNLVPSDKWLAFVDLIRSYIEEEIVEKGDFKMSVPMHYLHFVKT